MSYERIIFPPFSEKNIKILAIKWSLKISKTSPEESCASDLEINNISNTTVPATTQNGIQAGNQPAV